MTSNNFLTCSSYQNIPLEAFWHLNFCQIFFLDIFVTFSHHFTDENSFKNRGKLFFVYVLEARQDEKMLFLTWINTYTEAFIQDVSLILVHVLLLPMLGPPCRWSQHGYNFGWAQLKLSTSKSFTL